jgi:DUF4097 and DUF4098 domain-containing protein YvlB
MRQETFETAGPLALRIESPSGDVSVETVDGLTTEVELEGPDELVEGARVELRQKGEGHQLIVQTHPSNGLRALRSRSKGVDVKIRAPHGASIEASTASGDVTGRGRFGKVEVNSASGDVAFDEVAESAEANTASGDLEIGSLGGGGKLSSASGDVAVREVAGPLKVQTASGDQEIGSVSQGELSLQTASGDIQVGVKPGSKLWIDARSISGETSSDFELGDSAPEGEVPLVEIRANAVSGDIRVRRAV